MARNSVFLNYHGTFVIFSPSTGNTGLKPWVPTRTFVLIAHRHSIVQNLFYFFHLSPPLHSLILVYVYPKQIEMNWRKRVGQKYTNLENTRSKVKRRRLKYRVKFEDLFVVFLCTRKVLVLMLFSKHTSTDKRFDSNSNKIMNCTYWPELEFSYTNCVQKILRFIQSYFPKNVYARTGTPKQKLRPCRYQDKITTRRTWAAFKMSQHLEIKTWDSQNPWNDMSSM